MKGKIGKKTRLIIVALCVLFFICLLPDGFSENPNGVLTVQAAAKVKINKTTATLIKTQTLQLKITGTDSKVTWKSSKKAVASVDENGLVTANKKGNAVITATVDGKKYTCKIKVEAPSIKESYAMIVGDELQLILQGTNQKVSWTSSDEGIVTIRENGVAIAHKRGRVRIDAQVNDIKFTSYITVVKANSLYISLPGKKPKFKIGDSIPLGLSHNSIKSSELNIDSELIQWNSSDENIATVSKDGIMNIVGNGIVRITATYKGASLKKDIEVLDVDYINEHTKIKVDLEKIKDSKISRYDTIIVVESEIKGMFPIYARGDILLYDENHHAVATISGVRIYLEKGGASVTYSSIRGDAATATSYEWSLKYSLNEYGPLIDITDDITLSAEWTKKNSKDEKSRLEYRNKIVNTHVFTIENSSKYKIKKCVVKMKYYDIDGTVIFEGTREVYETFDGVTIATDQEVAKAEFELLYAYALMKD